MFDYSVILLCCVFVSMIGAGFILGMVGNAGGPLFMLVLLGVFQLPVKAAIGTALFASLVTGLIAFVGHRRLGHTHYPLALLAGFAGAIGATIGANISLNVSDEKLKNVLAIVILSVALVGLIKTLFSSKKSGAAAQSSTNNSADTSKPIQPFTATAKSIAFTLGLSVGSACGVLGLSGASPLSALFKTLLNYPMQICMGSAYLAATMTSLAGFLQYAFKGQIDWVYGLVLSLGMGAGIYLSTNAVKLIADKVLSIGVLVFTLIMATFTFVV